MSQVGHVDSLHLYPLKSGRAHDVARARVTRFGLEADGVADRQLMVVDRHGHFVTLRGTPALACVAVHQRDGRATFAAPGREPLSVLSQAAARAMDVVIWGERVPAVTLDAALDAWMSALLGDEVHVVRMADGFVREADRTYAGEGDAVRFADGFALLVTTTASLDALNRHLVTASAPVPMDRFRPNLVVRSEVPWAEDTWRRLRIGAVELELVKPCGRCVAVNVDQATGRSGREPLRTLAAQRTLLFRGKPKVIFGQNAAPRGVGEVHVGDPVVVLETTPSPLEPTERRVEEA